MIHVSPLTESSFEQEALSSDIPVLVDFWAPWCRPCALIANSVRDLAQEFRGRLKVHTVNVDEEPDLTRRYGIQSVPTLLVFKEGAVIRQRVGAAPRNILTELLRDLV